jgi:hypothetical protein
MTLLAIGTAPEAALDTTIPSQHSGRTRRLVSILAVATTLLLQLWLISGLLANVADRSPARIFASPLGHVAWIAPQGGGDHAWFRLDFGLRSVPLRALLWTQGQQFEAAYVNGLRVEEAVQQELPDVDTAPDYVHRLVPLDVTAALRRGRNAIGLEIISRGGQSVAARSALTIDYGSGAAVELGTTPTAWRVTTNVQDTEEDLPKSGSFSTSQLDDSRWQVPVLAGANAGAGLGGSGEFLPVTAYATSVDAKALTGPGTYPLVASASIPFPPSCASTWLTVAASGPLNGVVDGSAVIAQQQGAVSFGDPDPLESSRLAGSTPVVVAERVYDLSGLVRGTKKLTVSLETEGVSLSSIYATVSCEDGTRTLPLIPDDGWTARTAGGHYLALSPFLFGAHPLSVMTGTLSSPGWSGLRLHRHLRLLLVLALGVALVGGTIELLRRKFRMHRSTVLAMPLGLLPASVLVLAIGELRHWTEVVPPFPYTPDVERAVLGIAVAGILLAAFWLAVAPRKTMPAPEGALLPERPANTGQRRFTTAILLTSLILFVIVGWDIRFEPVWQDELSSLAAAQGIQQHGLPEWPSGFLYWKSELYSLLIAIVGALTHNSITILRLTTVATYAATVAIFGLYLTKLIWGRRWVLRYFATLLFALAPFELGHADDIRMYQLAQLFVVAVMVIFFRALHSSKPRDIWLSAVAVAGMYLAHEETFILLPVLPICFLFWHRVTFPNWRRWLTPTFSTGALISVQLTLAKFTHPPAFGDDASGGPLIRWSPAPFYYLDNFLFVHTGYGASITVVSTLAVLALIVGCWQRSTLRMYLGLYVIVPLAVVSTILPAKDTRYCFVLLPGVFALGVLGMTDIVGWVLRSMRAFADISKVPQRAVRRFLLAGGFCCLLLSTAGSFADYGPLVSRLTNGDLAARQQDYMPADEFVKTESNPGDIVIASGTVNLTAYGLGRTPDYWLGFRRDSRLLFLIEKHDEAVDTQYGIPILNNGPSLERVVTSGRRVWLVIGDSYVGGLLRSEVQILQSQFRLVYESQVVSVFESDTGAR